MGLQVTTLSGDTYRRNLGDADDRFHLNAYGAGAFVRLSTEVFGRAQPHSTHLDIYGQVGLGMTIGFSNLTIGSTKNGASENDSETDFGYMVNGAAGLSLVLRAPLAVFLQGGYDYAPTTKNLVGDVHDVGGPFFQTGLRFQFGQ